MTDKLYSVPKREFNRFNLNTPEIKIEKNIFEGTGDEEYEQYVVSNQVYSNNTSEQTKSYFKKLYSLPIPSEVKRKVEEDILSSNKRIHQIQDEILCAMIINAYHTLKLDYNFETIMQMMNIDPRKSHILHLLQKVNTKNTLINNQENSFAIIVIKPSKYINEVFESYLAKIQYDFRNKEVIINNIRNIMLKLEELYPPIIQKPPRECASILIYLYLKGNLDNNSRDIFNKKIFSELPNIVSTKFSTCYPDIKNKFYGLYETHNDFMKLCYSNF